MLRILLLGVFAFTFATKAYAGVTAEKFSWENSGRFFLDITVDGKPMEIRGNVRPGETVHVPASAGQPSAEVRSYATGKDSDAAISVILTVDGNDIAQVILIQVDNHPEILTPTAIPDRKATVIKDLEAVISYLKTRKSWNALAAFQWVRDWNNAAPGKSLFQFVDRVEMGEIDVPRPQSHSQIASEDQNSKSKSRGEQNYEVMRRAEVERQIRRGERPPPGYYGRYRRQPLGGYGYPPPPGYADNYQPQAQPQPGYGSGYPPPPSAQGGLFQQLFQ